MRRHVFAKFVLTQDRRQWNGELPHPIFGQVQTHHDSFTYIRITQSAHNVEVVVINRHLYGVTFLVFHTLENTASFATKERLGVLWYHVRLLGNLDVLGNIFYNVVFLGGFQNFTSEYDR